MPDTAALEAFIAERKRVEAGTISLTELTQALAFPEVASPPSPKVPTASAISERQRAALEKLNEVFGSVVPNEVRELLPDEVDSLMEERLTLDEIETLAKKRKDDIRTTVLNHVDATVEDEEGPRNKDGHVLRPTKVPSGAHGKAFSWEVSNRGGTIEAPALAALEAEGILDHDDYLAMTDQVRVVNEDKIMALLQKKPELLDVLRHAVTKTSQVGSLYVRGVEDG